MGWPSFLKRFFTHLASRLSEWNPIPKSKSHTLHKINTQWCFYNFEIAAPVRSRITYQTISELTFFMKVIQNFVVNNFYIIHFNDKVCWTSQILGENSWKIVTFFCCEFCFRQRRRGADDQCIKTNNKMSHFFQEFSPRICEVQQTLSLKWII